MSNEEATCQPPAMRKRIPSSVVEWQKYRPWPIIDQKEATMYCAWHRKHKLKVRGGHRREAWIDGIQCLKLQGVLDHERSRGHVESITSERMASSVRKAGGLQGTFAHHVETRADQCDKGMIAQMKVLSWIVSCTAKWQP